MQRYTLEVEAGTKEMTNAASAWRRRLAQETAKIYRENPHVDVIILGGSTARNIADQYSDIEIGVFWHQAPTDKERQALAEKTGGDILRLYPYDEVEHVWSDDLMLGRKTKADANSGVLIEIVHYTSAYMEATLDEVLERYNPDEVKQNLVAAIVDGVPLKTSKTLESWNAQVANYPYGLALAVVKRHAQIDHFWRWRMWLERGPNLMMFNKAMVQVEEKILHILLGLNREYYFGFKWVDEVINRMAIKPENFAQRIKEVHRLPPDESAERVIQLVDETYDLIEKQMPEVDVNWLRNTFHYERPAWEEQPPVLSW